MEGGGAEDEEDDGALLAEAVGRVGEEEAAEGDAGPKARGDVADARGGGVPVGDEEGDDPAGDADLGALVAEDEEGAEDGGLVGEGGFEEFGAGGGVGVRGGGAEEVDGRGVVFVVAVAEEGEDEVGYGDGEWNEVECGPGMVVGDQCRCHQWADCCTDTIGSMEAAKCSCRIGEVCTEDVVRSQVCGYS